MKDYPRIKITQEMIDNARELIPTTKVHRTIASPIDTLTGNLGEIVFAQWFYGDWKNHSIGKNKGDSDFESKIEIKTSSFPFNEHLHLLVRRDYAERRKPHAYVQIIIDIEDPKTAEIKPGIEAFLGGFASAEDIDNAPLKDFGSKDGGRGGYQCHYIRIKNLKPMSDFHDFLKDE